MCFITLFTIYALSLTSQKSDTWQYPSYIEQVPSMHGPLIVPYPRKLPIHTLVSVSVPIGNMDGTMTETTNGLCHGRYHHGNMDGTITETWTVPSRKLPMVYAMDGRFRIYALAIQWTVPLVVSVIQRIKFRHGRYKKLS